MTEDSIMHFGYVGLFVVSFLAATLLPGSSEVFVALMPARGYNVWVVLLFATTGNYLGALANYYIGKYSGNLLFARYARVSPEKLEKNRNLYRRWGAPILFFSWVPIIGDPLTVVAGMVRVRPIVFSFWVILGKILRYIAILGLAYSVIH